jgi:hypothetical protein
LPLDVALIDTSAKGALMRKVFGLVASLAALAALATVPAAFAGAESFTVVQKDVTESFTDVEPCGAGSADVTITYNFVFHVTVIEDGTYQFTGASAGTVTAVADGVTYTGHFAQRFGETVNLMNREETVVFTVHLTGTDGSRITFIDVLHFTVTATGVERSFEKPICA